MALEQVNIITGGPGLPNVTSGTQGIVAIADRQIGTLVSELNGRFYQLAAQGVLFSGGMALTSISNATYTTATVGATATPISGIYNPFNSGVNLVPLQVTLNLAVTAATSTGCGTFTWMTSVGNNVITTGAAGFNRKTLAASGGQGKDMTNAALTGLTTNLASKFGSALNGGSCANFSFVGTAVGQVTAAATGSVENFDGSILVPPGGVLVLMANTTPVAHSATSGILWAEIPV